MIPERPFAVWGWPAPVDLRKGFNGLLARWTFAEME
jgi:hypothetical protein